MAQIKDSHELNQLIKKVADQAAGQWLTKEDDFTGPGLTQLIEDAIKTVVTGTVASTQPELTSEWLWWASDADGSYRIGPCKTRQEAVDRAVEHHSAVSPGGPCEFYVIEVFQQNQKLSNFINVKSIWSCAEEDTAYSLGLYSYSPGNFFPSTKEQRKELEDKIKATIDQWQSGHGLDFTSPNFLVTRNEELVKIGGEA